MTTLWDTTGTAVVKELAAQRRTGGAVLSGRGADPGRRGRREPGRRGRGGRDARRRGAPVPAAGRGPPADRGAGAAPRRRGAHRRAARARRGRRDAHVRPARPARRVRRAAAAGRRRPRRHLVARRLRRTAGAPTPLAVFADRRITDSSIAGDPMAALRTRADDYAPGDTDLAWTRDHAVAGDPGLQRGRGGRAPRRPVRVTGGRSRATPTTPTAQLLAGWLSARCGAGGRRGAGLAGRPGASGVELRGRSSWTRTRRSAPRRPQGRRGRAASRTGQTPAGGAAGAVARRPAQRGAAAAGPRRAVPRRAGGRDRRRPALGDRSPTREHIWFDPAEAQRHTRPEKARARRQTAEPHRRTPQERVGGQVRARKADAAAGPTRSRAEGGQEGRPPTAPAGLAGRREVERRTTSVRCRTSSSSRTPTAGPGGRCPLVARLAAAQAVHGTASVVLTGGGSAPRC